MSKELTWENLFEQSGNNSGKKTFAKFPEGVTKIRIIDGVPHVRWVHWMPQFKRSVNCPGKGCPICALRKAAKANKEPMPYGMGKKFSLNIINRTTGGVEILDQGKTFFEDLRDIIMDNGNPLEYDIKVRRRGQDKDTSYRIDLDERYDIDDKDRELMNQKVDFNEYFKPHSIEDITRLIQGEKWQDVFSNKNNEGE